MTTTDCMPQIRFEFHPSRHVDVSIDAPETSSDGGLLLLRQLDGRLGLSERFAPMLTDVRSAKTTQHSRLEQLRQRVFQIAMGYADQNDATTLRNDPLWKSVCDRRPDEKDALSSQPSLSRFEHAMTARAVVELTHALEDDYVASLPSDTREVILDLDSTEDPTHGQQPMAFFNAHYDGYMYFPLLVFDAEGRLASVRLRPGNVGNAKYSTPLITRLVRKLKHRFPKLKILVRADGGFSIPRFFTALEELNSELGSVRYVVGIPQNKRLNALSKTLLDEAEKVAKESGHAARVFGTFEYAAGSWSRVRNVVVKAEQLGDKSNPRFVVTTVDIHDPKHVYESLYCPRGQAENAIKDFKRALAGDRLSCTTYIANSFRLFLHAVAYRLMDGLRRVVTVVSSEFGKRQLDTMRLLLLKVAAVVAQSARRITVHLPAAFPKSALYIAVAQALGAVTRTTPAQPHFAA
jgi:Transposase DDE domain group 1